MRFFLFLCLAGCQTTPLIEQGQDPPYKVHDQDKAMLLTESYVEDSYGLDLDRVWESSKVFWVTTVCPYHKDQYAVVYKGKCSYGRMWGCQDMYVALSNKDPERTCGSALVHEFGHCLRGKLGLPTYLCPGMDAPHKDIYFWSIIRRAHDETCNRGW